MASIVGFLITLCVLGFDSTQACNIMVNTSFTNYEHLPGATRKDIRPFDIFAPFLHPSNAASNSFLFIRVFFFKLLPSFPIHAIAIMQGSITSPSGTPSIISGTIKFVQSVMLTNIFSQIIKFGRFQTIQIGYIHIIEETHATSF